jgi:hypothetical protein
LRGDNQDGLSYCPYCLIQFVALHEPSGDFLDQVEGIVFKITAEELATSDEYGDTDYGRAMAHASSPTGTPGFTSNPKATAVATRTAPR